jgi:ABC-type branched-subunit amino acid transport system ATPase component
VTGDGPLEIRGVSKSYGRVVALQGVNATLGEPGVTGIIGPNGSGKTTLTNVLTGALRPTSGRIFWHGREITRKPLYKVARLGVTRTFQHTVTFPGLTVGANLVAALEVAGRARDELDDLLGAESPFASLAEYRDERAGDLPFGVARILGVALATVSRPRLVFLDEPAAGLNEVESRQLARTISATADAGTALVVIDHDMSFLLPLCRRVVVLDAGAVIADDTPDAIRSDPRVIEIYLGEKRA